MIANRYNGLQGNGRIVNFVIHNEVNRNEWYDIGCGQGVPCSLGPWVADYAANFNSAYDRIKTEQGAVKVFVSFNNEFAIPDNIPAGIVSAKTFLLNLAPLIAPRAWSVGWHPWHPYTVNFGSAASRGYWASTRKAPTGYSPHLRVPRCVRQCVWRRRGKSLIRHEECVLGAPAHGTPGLRV